MRAARIRQLQDDFLPLFNLLRENEQDFTCRLDWMMAALTILCNSAFEYKFNFILKIFGSESIATLKDGYFTLPFLLKLVRVFHDMLFKLKYLPFSPNQEELQNILERGFYDRKLSINDVMTAYDVKLFLHELFFWSEAVCRAFGVIPDLRFSTYQRNHMAAMALMARGLCGPTSCKYRHHYELVKYRAQLEPQHQQLIHERAMNMGESDPFKPDYSRFIIKPKKKGYSKVIPLDHGHLCNLHHTRFKLMTESSIKIQRVYRGLRERRIAELAAKRSAFLEAKELAIQEMRDKVIAEFERREESTGVGRVKWDAQIRIKQSKLRSHGQNLGRAEAVTVMMEEAIERAKAEILARFDQIEAQEGLGGEAIEKAISLRGEGSGKGGGGVVGDVFGFKVFGLVFRVNALDQSATDAEALSQVNTIQTESRTLDEVAVIAANEAQVERVLSHRRTLEMIRGHYVIDPIGRGETLMQREFRLNMAHPEPESEHYVSRLMALDPAMTLLKVSDLVLELPTKQLLLKYVQCVADDVLIEELREHFRLVRNYESVARFLKSVLTSDRVLGLEPTQTLELQYKTESTLRQFILRETKKDVANLEETVARKVAMMEVPDEKELLLTEVARIKQLATRFSDSTKEVYASLLKFRERLKHSLISEVEIDHRLRDLKLLQGLREGKEISPLLTIDCRTNWIFRLNNALRAAEGTVDDTVAKYTEIKAVCQEFFDQVMKDVMIIISEFSLPKYRKTILVSEEREVNGRPSVSGRGHDGKAYTFEAHNIIYTVCADYDGVFNGSDEYAAKAAGHDRLGSLQYFRCHLPKLNVPLVATVDYYGYRVLAVSKLNKDKIVFNNEGEVRRVSDDLVHGVQKNGLLFVNKSKLANSLLSQAASSLRLAEHYCRGSKDINALKTYCSSDIQVYRGPDEEFYMHSFWRAFPPESPTDTPHLLHSPREQSIFWRQLRPELCKKYDTLLSPDACCQITYGVPDEAVQSEGVSKATVHMIQELIPAMIRELSLKDLTLPLSQGYGLDVAEELHQRGINVRHLGLIRSLVWQELYGDVSLYFQDRIIRTQKDLRDEVFPGYLVRIDNLEFTVVETSTRTIASNAIPINTTHLGKTYKNVKARCGSGSLDRNSEELRMLFLAEMTARVVKWRIRSHLRNHAQQTLGCSFEFYMQIMCYYLNAITGSSPVSVSIWQEEIYEGLKLRFGKRSVALRERDNLCIILQPAIIYIIRRLQIMIGVHLCYSAVAEFHERPVGFTFIPQDIVRIVPVLKHNIPYTEFADAMLITLQAEEAVKSSYQSQVLLDEPEIYFPCRERKGARIAENRGTLGRSHIGAISSGCELELPGPIASDPHSRAAGFNSEKAVRIDTKYNAQIIPQSSAHHFSVEAFVRCTGSFDVHRVVVMTGRYSLNVDRENCFAFTLVQGVHELTVQISKVLPNVWYHVVVTYDGTSVRSYIDSVLVLTVEMDYLMTLKEEEYAKGNDELRRVIDEDEERAKERMKVQSKKQAEAYFKSQEGIDEMREAALAIYDSDDFQDEVFDFGDDIDDQTLEKKKKKEALVRAKRKYASELYTNNVRDVIGAFRLQRKELEDRIRRDREEGLARMRRGVRIGASFPSAGSRDGKSFFHGHLSNISLYSKCLSSDRIRVHYMAIDSNRARDAQRLYAVAATKYEEAVDVAAEDCIVLKKYAKAICSYFSLNVSGVETKGVEDGKIKIRDAIQRFKSKNIADGIAEILVALPTENEYAELASLAYNTIKEMDSRYFCTDNAVTRKDLIHLPHKFGLDIAGNQLHLIATAASMYKDVVSDLSLSDVYGDVNMYWIGLLASDELVIALIKHAMEDGHLRTLKIGEVFKDSRRESINITNNDVKVRISHTIIDCFSECFIDLVLLSLPLYVRTSDLIVGPGGISALTCVAGPDQ